MKKYSVEVPIAGRAVIEVEAPNAEAAIHEAMQAIGQEHIEEWECYRRIVQGNVCYAPLHSAEATEIENDR